MTTQRWPRVILSWGHDDRHYRLVYVGPQPEKPAGNADGPWPGAPTPTPRHWRLEWLRGFNAMGDSVWMDHRIADSALVALCEEYATEEAQAAEEDEA